MSNACRLLLTWLTLLPGSLGLDSSSAALTAATGTTWTVGGDTNYWNGCCAANYGLTVTVGDKLSFGYSAAHNVYRMASETAYNDCDFTGATELASTSHGGGSGSTPNLYEAVVSSAGTLYIACQVSSHCQYNQKVTITAAAASPSPPSPSPSPSPPPPSPSSPVSVSTPAGCAVALGETRTVVDFQNVPLSQPTALAWHPTHTSELWVTDAASSSITVLDTSSGATRQLADRAPYHYMARVSSISFDSVGQFATCQESINTYEGQMMPNFFMGPTLYDSRHPRGFTDSRQLVRRALLTPVTPTPRP